MTVRTWAQCMKIVRTDSTVIALTELDKDISYGGDTFEASISYTPTTLDGTANLSVNNAETGGFLSISGLQKDDIIGGKYDGAAVYFLLIDYSSETLVRELGKGFLGEAEIKGEAYKIEYRSLSQLLQQTIGDFYTAECNTGLGSSRCGVTLASYTDTGTVTSVTSNQTFVDSSFIGSQSDDYYNYGKMTFTSGINNGFSMEVKDYNDATGQFTLFMPMPFTVATSDAFSVYAGCDTRKATCISKFNNVINFRGYDMIPGQDQINLFGGQ